MEETQGSDLKRFKCQKHKKKIEFLYLKNDLKSKLACSKCILEYKLDYSYIVDIDQLLQQKEETIINNLPPFISEELISLLNRQNINADQLIDEVEKEFETQTKTILSAMKEYKIQIINQIHLIEDLRSQVIQTYNQISSKEELQKKIIELLNTPEELENYLKEMIAEKKSTLQRDKNQIVDSLHQFTKEAKKVNLQNIQNNLSSILENVRSTNFVQSNQTNSSLPNHSISQNDQNNNATIPNSQISSSQIPWSLEINDWISEFPLIDKQIQISSIEGFRYIQNIRSFQNIYLYLPNQFKGEIEVQQLSGCLEACEWINQLELYLDQNNITNSGVVHLSKAFKKMKYLSHLTLNLNGNQNLSEEGIDQLCKSLLRQQKAMNYFNLSLSENDNVTDQIVEEHVIPLVSSFTKLTCLHLDLSSTKTGGNTVRQIANALKSLSNLKKLKLNLSGNQINDDDAFILLSNEIQNLKESLIKVQLFLGSIQIGDKGALSLINAISTCTHLKSLWLHLIGNKIGKECKIQMKEIKQRMKNKLYNINKIIMHLN